MVTVQVPDINNITDQVSEAVNDTVDAVTAETPEQPGYATIESGGSMEPEGYAIPSPATNTQNKE